MKRKRLPHIIAIGAFAVFIVLSLASASTPEPLSSSQQQQTNQTPVQQVQQPQPPVPKTQPSLFFTGDGKKGISIAILAPKSTGLTENQNYLPALVQGEFVSNFSGYSAISVLDRQRLDDQYAELFSGYYDDKAQAGLDFGHLTPTTHIMGGTITKTATGYALQMQITKTTDKMIEASYSGACTFAELDNLTGIRRASLELLKKMGVTPTERTQTELTEAAVANHVNAQTALAQGITAQRQGTEVAALSYYFQAATYDPSLKEAVSRSSILNADITSGNIGDNVRNDIQWRKNWVARLTETERYFDSFNRTQPMRFTLFYTDEIKQGTVNYQNETVTLNIETYLHGTGGWTLSIERALRSICDGLAATNRIKDWGLAGWPKQGVTNLKLFPGGRRQDFSVVFELLNDQKKIIGREALWSGGGWKWSLHTGGGSRVFVEVGGRETLNFQNVNANDITDRMTIRVTTVNGTAAETAARNGILQIRAGSVEFNKYDCHQIKKGALYLRPWWHELLSDSNNTIRFNYDIPNIVWDETVISIGEKAFSGCTSLTGITILDSVTIIGGGAFYGCENLTSVTIPNSVTTIEDALPDTGGSLRYGAFSNCTKLTSVTIGNSVTTIRISEQTIYRYVANGEIPYHKLSRAVRFKPSEIESWMESRKAEAAKHEL